MREKNIKKDECESGEKKSPMISNTRDNKKQGSYTAKKPYKSKIKTIKDNIFEIGSTKNAAQFS